MYLPPQVHVCEILMGIEGVREQRDERGANPVLCVLCTKVERDTVICMILLS